MNTEIQGDFKGYVCRFKLPSAKCFAFPLKSAAIAFIIQAITAVLLGIISIGPATAIILLMECLFLIGFYVKVLYKEFWNTVLEESKGLFADLFMWIYYIFVCAISLIPSAIFFVILDNYIGLGTFR
jgi:hypothetical protein